LLEGNERHDDFDYPDEEYRYYIAAREFGWTPQQLDDSPAVVVDWIMAIHGLVEELKSEAERKAARG
jgi:hypothetical protein